MAYNPNYQQGYPPQGYAPPADAFGGPAQPMAPNTAMPPASSYPPGYAPNGPAYPAAAPAAPTYPPAAGAYAPAPGYPPAVPGQPAPAAYAPPAAPPNYAPPPAAMPAMPPAAAPHSMVPGMPNLTPEMAALMQKHYGDAIDDLGGAWRQISLANNRFTLSDSGNDEVVMDPHTGAPATVLNVAILSIYPRRHKTLYAKKFGAGGAKDKPYAVWFDKDPDPPAIPAHMLVKGDDDKWPYQIAQRLVVCVVRFNPHAQTPAEQWWVDTEHPFVLDVKSGSIFGDNLPQQNAYSLKGFCNMLKSSKLAPCCFLTTLIFDYNAKVPTIRFVPSMTQGRFNFLDANQIGQLLSLAESPEVSTMREVRQIIPTGPPEGMAAPAAPPQGYAQPAPQYPAQAPAPQGPPPGYAPPAQPAQYPPAQPAQYPPAAAAPAGYPQLPQPTAAPAAGMPPATMPGLTPAQQQVYNDASALAGGQVTAPAPYQAPAGPPQGYAPPAQAMPSAPPAGYVPPGGPPVAQPAAAPTQVPGMPQAVDVNADMNALLNRVGAWNGAAPGAPAAPAQPGWPQQ